MLYRYILSWLHQNTIKKYFNSTSFIPHSLVLTKLNNLFMLFHSIFVFLLYQFNFLCCWIIFYTYNYETRCAFTWKCNPTKRMNIISYLYILIYMYGRPWPKGNWLKVTSFRHAWAWHKKSKQPFEYAETHRSINS